MAMSATPAQVAQKKTRQRSPSYPGVDLETALERAAVLRTKEGRNFAAVNAVVQHWGYGIKSSTGYIVLAALKKFGLLEEQGSGDARRVRLTNLAQKILLDDRQDSPDRLRLIQEAALTPPIHAELWQEFDGSMPSDTNLRYNLRMQRGFSDAAVGEFIDEFRSTIAFAKLEDSDMLSGREEDVSPREREDDMRADPNPPGQSARNVAPPPVPTDPRLRAIQLPLARPEWATLQVPYPLNEADWAMMMALLTAMKPALVPPVEQQTTQTSLQQDASEPAAH